MSEKKDIANGTGFRWYWLLDYEMSDYVKQRYNCSWSRKEDNYFLYRREGKRIDDRGDFFIIIRTSEKCYRVSYYSMLSRKGEFASFRRASDAADFVDKMARDYDYKKELINREIIKHG